MSSTTRTRKVYRLNRTPSPSNYSSSRPLSPKSPTVAGLDELSLTPDLSIPTPPIGTPPTAGDAFAPPPLELPPPVVKPPAKPSESEKPRAVKPATLTRIPRKPVSEEDKLRARAVIGVINGRVAKERKEAESRRVQLIPFGQQRRIARTIARRTKRKVPRQPLVSLKCQPCDKVFSSPVFYKDHCATKKHKNKLWSKNRPLCKVCPYVPTAHDDWIRHINGRKHQNKFKALN